MPGVIINKLNASLHRNHIDSRYIIILFTFSAIFVLLQCVIKPAPGRCNHLQCGNMYQCGGVRYFL